ncbi:AbiJ-NTD4 domain-containing protein [Nitrosomonas eutropha]|uniref:HEPN AbiJ-N-terminal domain-containing protein n=2 Tax=Nitrosomonas eutropha TaxID=916 RepID=A0ABX5M3K8_9PROT|nr:hypothetical protein [Nitrosomonas eutropha]ABI58650.1 conserved hypothetical protein [Nitrosomonas eutropha C91]PXV74497.1 hypothetical protein C8R14_1446 [Nitrosomonas eutropha]SEI42782.1 hypothetical protein SAMN05216318_102120 [Nitrosomonas eutropha]
MVDYFSDRENGPRPRIGERVSPSAWGGIVGLVQSLIATGAFGVKFPEMCPDGNGPCGTDESALALAVGAELPGLAWPLETHTTEPDDGFFAKKVQSAPDTLVVLDFVEFCYRSVAAPIQEGFHSFFSHHHLSFNVAIGRASFRSDINRLFSRNNLAYELNEQGQIQRLAPPILREALAQASVSTGDVTLDQMLDDARRKYLNPDSRVRREALERLWDCWERLKSLEAPSNKKQSVSMLLAKSANEPKFLSALDAEACALTDIGNSFHIRHSEVTQSQVTDSQHVDYLFHRLFALVRLLAAKRSAR